MTLNLDTLRKTAEAATPGPWDLYSTQDYEVFCAANFTDSNYDPPAVTYGSDRSDDAEFIATFDPPTVLALLSRLEQAEQQVQAVLRLADSWETGALRWEDPLRVPNEVFLLRKALHQPTHEPDWTDYQLGDPGASCSCGYNGPYKECWQSRRALDGDSNE